MKNMFDGVLGRTPLPLIALVHIVAGPLYFGPIAHCPIMVPSSMIDLLFLLVS